MERDPETAMPVATASEELDYETALAELDTVLGRLEDGRVPLEEAMALYERGVGLVRRCGTLLEGAERRVVELSASPEGPLLEREFAPELDEEENGSSGG